MYQEILENLGLSPNEARIYESLVEQGESTISEIATRAKVHRRNAYDVIQRLVNKGLCFPIFSAHENRYNAVDPDKLLELVQEKREQLERVLPELRQKFQVQETASEVFVYRGLEGQKNIWRDVLRVGKDSYFIGAKGGWFDSRLEASRLAYLKETVRKKIKIIQLFDAGVKEKFSNLPRMFLGNLEYRFLPKGYDTEAAIHIFGDYVVTYSGIYIGKLDENVVFFVMKNKSLADSYRIWFKLLWDLCAPEPGQKS